MLTDTINIVTCLRHTVQVWEWLEGLRGRGVEGGGEVG